ncbi:TPA: hypothetical protein IAA87_01260 [Candidatus Avigastranaerophilus faecigallinarum]|nr:hypothetical protein [Candidatus Avigastranaerophilus faecigallinarum]
MKINEYKKLAINLFLLPLIPTVILYKHSFLNVAVIVLSIFWFFAILCFLSESFSIKVKKRLNIIGSFLGKYIAIVTLAIVYIVAVLPTGLLMKIVKRDRLRLKKPNVETYWLDNENKNTDYEYQF